MNKSIIHSEKISIRSVALDEYWLQDQIWNNPSLLNLGDLQTVTKEKKQSSGGKLDILLKDPLDNSMYEVEVMLGETDPSHIIRTIEYWDLEKRRYPQRQHFAVLVAETISRRFFNIIQLLSLNIPIIGIHAELLKVGEQHVLNFVTVLDVYEEPEDEEVVGIEYWNQHSKWTLELAQQLLSMIKEKDEKLILKFVKSYIAISDGKRNIFAFHKRSEPRSLMVFIEKEQAYVENIKKIFDDKSIAYDYNKWKEFIVNLDMKTVNKSKDAFVKLFELKKRINTETEETEL